MKRESMMARLGGPAKMDWQEALFNEGEIIAYKEVLTEEEREQGKWVDPYNHYTFSGERFFCINPCRDRKFGQGGGNVENVKEYRNILVEWDELSLVKQLNLVEKVELPFNTATFSGGKSIHFIISMKESFESLKAYQYYAKLIQKALGADESTYNPNRLSRTPGALRNEGNEQTLLAATGRRLTTAELFNWLLTQEHMSKPVDKVIKFLQIEEERAAKQKLSSVEGAKTIMPAIYQKMLTEGALHPNTNSRHDSLIKFGTWLKANWHDQGEIEQLLYQAEAAMGIGGRGDAEGVMRWLGL